MSSNLLDIVSAGAGIVFGGPAQNKLGAAAVALKSQANTAAQNLGERLGTFLGPQVFDSLSAGAAKTSSIENRKLLSQALSTPQGKQVAVVIGVALLAALYFLFRKVA